MKKIFLSCPAFHLRLRYVLLIFFSLNFITGCMYYYRVTTKTKLTPEDIRWEDFNGKYLILHSGDSAWQMNEISVDSSILSCRISALPDDHRMYMKTNPDKINRFRKSASAYEGNVLKEIHLYSTEKIKRSDKPVSLDFSSLKKMEIYKYAAGASDASWAIPVVVPISVVGITALIIALTKSSCPYVYISEGDSFRFAGEIFSGAVYSSLERNDYLPLPGFNPANGKYRVKIANRLPEIQHLNLSELWIISHPENTDVLADKYGKIHTLGSVETPVSAVTAGMTDRTEMIKRKDKNYFLFDEEPSLTGDTSAKNSLILTFDIPSGQDSGKLVVRAKNSFWGDYIFGEFTKQFGKNYVGWVKKKGKESPDKAIKWKKDQNLPLMVYLETRDGWQFVDYFDLAGPLAFRDMIMLMDLSKANRTKSGDREQVRIRIETGFMFWELDYAAIDLTKDLPVNLVQVQPSSAINETGKDVKSLLTLDDKHYYIQPSTSNEVVLDFNASSDKPGLKKSVVIHTKGYYEHIRYYRNLPDREKLLTFRRPGRLSQFSFERFLEGKKKYSMKYSSGEIK